MKKKCWDKILYLSVIITAVLIIYGLFMPQPLLLLLGILGLVAIPKIKMHGDYK